MKPKHIKAFQDFNMYINTLNGDGQDDIPKDAQVHTMSRDGKVMYMYEGLNVIVRDHKVERLLPKNLPMNKLKQADVLCKYVAHQNNKLSLGEEYRWSKPTSSNLWSYVVQYALISMNDKRNKVLKYSLKNLSSIKV